MLNIDVNERNLFLFVWGVLQINFLSEVFEISSVWFKILLESSLLLLNLSLLLFIYYFTCNQFVTTTMVDISTFYFSFNSCIFLLICRSFFYTFHWLYWLFRFWLNNDLKLLVISTDVITYRHRVRLINQTYYFHP